MKLIVISSAVNLPGEAGLFNLLFESGLECLHLRKPDATETDMARLLSQIDPRFLPQIAVHQHFDIALKYGIRRLHFTESLRVNTHPEVILQKKNEGFTLSTSIHKFVTINTLTPFDYTFFGPVFNSISKPGYPGISQPDLELDTTEKRLPVIALGGIDRSNIHKIREMNFDGAAVLGTLWNNPAKAPETFIKLKTLLNQ